MARLDALDAEVRTHAGGRAARAHAGWSRATSRWATSPTATASSSWARSSRASRRRARCRRGAGAPSRRSSGSTGVPAIFTEVGTPQAVVDAIAGETGVRVVPLPSHTLPADGSYLTFIRDIATARRDGALGLRAARCYPRSRGAVGCRPRRLVGPSTRSWTTGSCCERCSRGCWSRSPAPSWARSWCCAASRSSATRWPTGCCRASRRAAHRGCRASWAPPRVRSR